MVGSFFGILFSGSGEPLAASASMPSYLVVLNMVVNFAFGNELCLVLTEVLKVA